MPPPADARKIRQWQQRMARFDRAKKSIAQFCQDEGVSGPSFYRWRKKLQQIPQRSPQARQRAVAFTPVRLVASQHVAVRLPGGTQLDVPTADSHVLQLAIQTLAQVDAERVAGGESC